MSDLVRENERLDELGDGLAIIQHPNKYCFTSDAVSLANCIKAGADDIVFDLGSGSGIISILVAKHTKAKKIIGLDIQPDMVDMANRSARYNGLDSRVGFENIKIQDAVRHFGHEAATIAVCNPPYRKIGAGDTSENPAIKISRSETAVTLAEVADAAGRLLKTGGHFYMVHQAERLVEIFCTLKHNKIEPKVLRFINPQTVIIEGIKGGKGGIKCFI